LLQFADAFIASRAGVHQRCFSAPAAARRPDVPKNMTELKAAVDAPIFDADAKGVTYVGAAVWVWPTTLPHSSLKSSRSFQNASVVGAATAVTFYDTKLDHDSLDHRALTSAGCTLAWDQPLPGANARSLLLAIVDDAGAWGESALPFWKRIIRRFAQRFDLAMSKASVVVMGAVSSAVMNAMMRRSFRVPSNPLASRSRRKAGYPQQHVWIDNNGVSSLDRSIWRDRSWTATSKYNFESGMLLCSATSDPTSQVYLHVQIATCVKWSTSMSFE
jgi:hypothetical protein